MAGRRYMDFHGNNVHHVGYAHPHVLGAIRAQLDELSFAPRRYASERAVELAEALSARFRGLTGVPGRVLFTTGGSDAVEVAIKLARAATGRFKTLSFWDAFHGAGMGSASVGGESLFRSGRAVGPLMPGSEHVAPFGCYRCAYGHPVDEHGQPRLDQCRLACASMVRYVLEREGDVAAVVAEPARAVPFIPPPGYWQAVAEACRAHGTLLIFDEIPTGLGKTGRFFAAEHDGAKPDIVVLGKALGGGVLPIAACIARTELNVARDYAFGHYTHEKNPTVEREGLVQRARDLGGHFLAGLEDLKAEFECVGNVTGLGLNLAVDLVTDRESRGRDGETAARLLAYAMDHGVSFKLIQGNVLNLKPPLVISRGEIDEVVETLRSGLRTLGAARHRGP